MKQLRNLLPLLLIGTLAVAQTKTTSPATSTAIVSVIEAVTGKHFLPDTAYAALSEEDETLLAKEPVANWSLLQESKDMVYSNLVIGTRSYQLIVVRPSKTGIPIATLLRFVTAKSKPEPIARGTLQAKEEKPK
ncbi:hypothetical protein [Spirosoma validum]|uniref:Uncharacterized protein n=1 Tax=Spirosoma validum TaxID=2771355 RepID=A0A927GBJ7_9BACT|nr:hypothetical protein [Spirosoma validum]MBD2751466.1 hypothetical protein [Spirosoma validum]